MRTWTTAILAVLALAACGGDGSGTDEGGDPGSDPSTDVAPPQDTPDGTPDPGDGDEGGPDQAGGLDESPADPGTDVPAGPLEPREVDGKVVVSNGTLTLSYDLAKGTFDLGRVPGEDGLLGAHSEAFLNVQGADTLIRSSDPGPRIIWQSVQGADELGNSVQLRFDASPQNKIGGVATYITLHQDTPAVTFRTIVAMPFKEDVTVMELRPVVARFADGATLHLGDGTKDAVLVDNGSEILVDFAADARIVGENPGGLAGPGFASNWSASLCTAARSCAVAGFVTAAKGIGLVTTDQKAGEAVTVEGQEGLTLFELRTKFLPPAGLDLARALTSDMAYLDLTSEPHEALLRLGRAMAAFNGRPAPAVPPSSWNSWGGGAGSGGPGQAIDETMVLANLDAATRDFQPYGMSHFLVDDGWQLDDGSWTTDPAKFPKHGADDGMKWLSAQIETAGFVPGIWSAPFRVHKDAPLATAHPDWLLTLDDFGTMALGAGSDYRILDPTVQGVKDHLKAVYERLAKDWGYRFFKLDFSVYAMFGASYSAAGKSGVMAYREALKVIRDAIGPESFLLAVAGTHVNMGIADGVRLGLDGMPRWGDPQSPFDQGLKPAVLTASHRYWMGNTLWSSHPDLLFFRNTQGLAADEARAYALWTALLGGIVKLGETFTFVADHADVLDLVQRMVPTVATLAEPLDLYRMRWPEAWRARFDGPGGPYEVFGAFHWGLNRDLPAQADTDESPRTVTLPAAASPAAGKLGRVALDPLSGELLTSEGSPLWPGAIPVTLAPRTGRLLVVRDVPDTVMTVPVFLATDRHLLGGVAEVASAVTDATTGTLTVTFKAAVPQRMTTVWVLAPTTANLLPETADSAFVGHLPAEHGDWKVVGLSWRTVAADSTLTVRYATP